MKSILTFSVLAIMMSTTIYAEPLNYNVVEFSESASVEVPRDMMTIYLSVNQEGSRRADVQQAFVRKYNVVSRQIESNPEFKSELLNRSIYPQYQYKNGKQTQIGWQETAQFKVKSKNFIALNRLIADTKDNANLNNISFSISKQKREKVVDEISKIVLKRFQERANTVVHTLGFNSYKIVHLSLNQLGNDLIAYNGPRVASMLAVTAEPREMADTPNPGTEEIKVTVNGSIQM